MTRASISSLLRGALLLLATTATLRAQSPSDDINKLIANETGASAHRGYYSYMSEEKSDRTNGHVWVEKVAETPGAKVRMLLQEDGHPLSPDRIAQERGRLAAEANDPAGFLRQEAAHNDDEQHARQMLLLLPKAFLFDPPIQEGDTLKIQFHPNPSYQPQGLEERVLHGMSGAVLIDAKAFRMRGLDARMPQDISLGFGLLATIKAGSNFSTRREPLEGTDWKTQTLHTDINGKAMFLKSIARQQESKRWDYKQIPNGTTVPQAVAIVEQ